MPVKMYCNQWESDDQWELNSHHTRNIQYNPIMQATLKDNRIQLLLVFVRSESDLLVESYECANIYCVCHFSTKIAY